MCNNLGFRDVLAIPSSIKRWLIARKMSRSSSVFAYEKNLRALRHYISEDPGRLYFDYGVSKVLARLSYRPSTVYERLQIRLKSWYQEQDGRFWNIAGLVNKKTMRKRVESLGVPLPAVYFCGRDMTSLDMGSLPERFVAKPHGGSNAKGIFIMNGSRELLSGKEFDRKNSSFRFLMSDFVLSSKGANEKSEIIIEEFQQDWFEADGIPLDYKAHCYGGKVRFFQVINRNEGRRSQSFYTREWKSMPAITKSYPEGERIPRPPCLPELIRYADIVAGDLKQMIRLDFYVTKRGPVFGEFTTYPGAGKNYTVFGNALAIQCWELYPDEPSLY